MQAELLRHEHVVCRNRIPRRTTQVAFGHNTREYKTMKNYLILATATLISGPAFAGGLNEVAPEPMLAPVEAPMQTSVDGDWSGAYVGAQLGYGDIDSNGAGADGNGTIGGLHAGYRNDFGKFVAGAELDYDVADIDLGATGDTLDNVARLKFMGGLDLGRSLLYATAGAAYADATVGGIEASDNGYFVGVGMDYAVSDRFTVGGEYLMHKFDDFDGSGVDLDADTIKAKVSFTF